MDESPIIGRKILHFDTVDSTNDLAHEYAERGEPEGLIISAQEQTGGRGRMGRRWLAPYGTSLQLSVLLRPPLSPQTAARLTRMAALAVSATLSHTLHVKPVLKWPNDVLLPVSGADDTPFRKVAGILTESGLRDDALDFCIIGIGLNGNFSMQQYPDLVATATTLRDVLGHPVELPALEHSLLAQLERYYARVRAGDSLLEEYRAQLAMLGKPITVSTPSGIVQGVAASVAEDGALVLECDQTQLTLYAGDVTILKSNSPAAS